jgi:predicted nucleotide-binding protein
MQPNEELFEIAKKLDIIAAAGDGANVTQPLNALETAVNQIRRSFSGSWLGYHSRVYYEGLRPAPPGANFSQEWGLQDLSFTSLGSRGDWTEYDSEEVKKYIFATAGNPDLATARKKAAEATAKFGEAKSEIVSVLENELAGSSDPFLAKLRADIEKIEPTSKAEVCQHLSPKAQIMTRDMVAMGQGTKVPPHVDVGSEVVAIQHSFGICKAAADIARKAASHLERKNRRQVRAGRVGTNVFIGHGRSKVWRELKDFIQDRLQLPWDEFNRVPIAGVTNIARLSEMLDAAAVALLVMTAEDEMTDGAMQARMNVVHEAGLFQGRLGFTKAIVLVEEGCAEFSNIQGLGQIRFPKGNIDAAFEHIRRVLEREGLLETER